MNSNKENENPSLSAVGSNPKISEAHSKPIASPVPSKSIQDIEKERIRMAIFEGISDNQSKGINNNKVTTIYNCLHLFGT